MISDYYAGNNIEGRGRGTIWVNTGADDQRAVKRSNKIWTDTRNINPLKTKRKPFYLKDPVRTAQ
jgi:hypothetical protein